ncbi:Extracellular matrix-binding ebh, putative [Babesia ovata]|uniref:Extracellular matrix-binding ebh, putative n=1 Tax=Babesia ovata TaxID=189622 RepID=A0A2H6KHM6_9APIC|nr:Extracellular matrix-binding ebh, putative [Babesia ovata]GBE62495.1 Extracellular matrix-binding ebh, putative [Babesia ovata]
MRVGEALQAVVAMDGDLKKDLKKVKEEIKKGIKDVIEDLNVLSLDTKVKEDLQALRGKIEKLAKDVDQNDQNVLVSGALAALKSQKKTLDEEHVNKIKDETNTNLEKNFNEQIQQPLSKAVSDVGTAIGTLGGTFGLDRDDDKKSVEKIFRYIKDKVAAIKGNKGNQNGWKIENATGLTGIAQGVEHYFNFFKSDFGQAVGGWVDGILGQNGVVKKLLSWQDKPADGMKSTLENTNLGGFIRSPINSKADDAATALKGVNDNAGITQKIEAVKKACEYFANKLDEALKDTKSGVLAMVSEAKNASKDRQYNSHRTSLQRSLENANCGCGDCKSSGGKKGENCLKCDKKECNLTQAIATTLVAVSSVSRQVGKELNSVLLGKGTKGISIAELLDQAKKATEDLDGQLTDATDSSQGTDGKSPAQAVDTAIGGVRKMVEQEITNKFNNEVKQPLADAVKELPGAVQEFDRQAQTQIKEAARTYLSKALSD